MTTVCTTLTVVHHSNGDERNRGRHGKGEGTRMLTKASASSRLHKTSAGDLDLSPFCFEAPDRISEWLWFRKAPSWSMLSLTESK